MYVRGVVFYLPTMAHNHLADQLEFNLRLPYAGQPKLVMGQLVAKNRLGIYASYNATSGTPGNQYKGSQRLKGRGPLPATSQLGHLAYTVHTTPINLMHVKGVEGDFYRILPFEVCCSGVWRGDFGVHRDANVPGSAGCIVLADRHHWARFQALMRTLEAANVKAIPLRVNYLDPQ